MNAKVYAWPSGWDDQETIASQLECSPERVREHLAPGIRAGEIEVKTFTVWDPQNERKVQKTGFRIVNRSENRQDFVKTAPKRASKPAPKAGMKITRRLSKNKEVGLIKRVSLNSMLIAWPSGEKSHSLRGIRRGELAIVD